MFVYLPFCFSFWIVYGGKNITEFQTFDILMMTTFRMWVVDEYPFDGMWEQDFVMSYILVTFNILVTAVIFMNLMIALLSDSFQRIFDNAYAVALLQQAESIMNHEHYTMDVNEKFVFASFLDTDSRTDKMGQGGNPLQESYDDDGDEDEDDQYGDMKKASVRSVEILEEIKEHFHGDDHHDQSYSSLVSKPGRPKSGGTRTGPNSDNVVLSAKINTLTLQLNTLAKDYNEQKTDMRKILDQLNFITSKLK